MINQLSQVGVNLSNPAEILQTLQTLASHLRDLDRKSTIPLEIEIQGEAQSIERPELAFYEDNIEEREGKEFGEAMFGPLFQMLRQSVGQGIPAHLDIISKRRKASDMRPNLSRSLICSTRKISAKNRSQVN